MRWARSAGNSAIEDLLSAAAAAATLLTFCFCVYFMQEWPAWFRELPLALPSSSSTHAHAGHVMQVSCVLIGSNSRILFASASCRWAVSCGQRAAPTLWESKKNSDLSWSLVTSGGYALKLRYVKNWDNILLSCKRKFALKHKHWVKRILYCPVKGNFLWNINVTCKIDKIRIGHMIIQRKTYRCGLCISATFTEREKERQTHTERQRGSDKSFV